MNQKTIKTEIYKNGNLNLLQGVKVYMDGKT